MVLSKETSLFKKDSISDDISEAKTKASAFIQEITNDGVFVHQTDSGKNGTTPTASTAYGVHISDSVNIVKAGKIIASYGDTIRIGATDVVGKWYMVLSNDGFDIYWNSAQAGTIVKVFHFGKDYVDYSLTYTSSDATASRGTASFASGDDCIASGARSRAGGERSRANGANSVAEGERCIANSGNSRAIGSYTTANALGAVASGNGAEARANYSHALGVGVITNSTTGQMVIGSHNRIPDSYDNFLFVIGNGNGSESPSNCFTVDRSGNVHVFGNLYLHGSLIYTGGGGGM